MRGVNLADEREVWSHVRGWDWAWSGGRMVINEKGHGGRLVEGMAADERERWLWVKGRDWDRWEGPWWHVKGRSIVGIQAETTIAYENVTHPDTWHWGCQWNLVNIGRRRSLVCWCRQHCPHTALMACFQLSTRPHLPTHTHTPRWKEKEQHINKSENTHTRWVKRIWQQSVNTDTHNTGNQKMHTGTKTSQQNNGGKRFFKGRS